MPCRPLDGYPQGRFAATNLPTRLEAHVWEGFGPAGVYTDVHGSLERS
jgi:hypothetical protein